MSALLEVENLTLSVPGRDPLLRGISFEVGRGESVALVGESGSGKSLTTRAALGLFPDAALLGGAVRTVGTNMVGADRDALREVRRNRASMIFQDPRAGINPVRKVGDFLTETLVRWRGLSKDAARKRAITQLEQVGLSRAESLLDLYPHQLSGGMLQRVMIAGALLDEPELILCDEPTTALDVTTQASIVDLLREQQQSRQMGMLFITHDLGLAASLCERVIVLRAGQILEAGLTEEVFRRPREEYTRELLAATPTVQLDSSGATGRPLSRDECGGNNAPAIRAESISKVYHVRGRDDVRALGDVSFTLERGGSLGIVGESGSGKSTFARILVGLEPATEGELKVDGVSRPKRALTAAERRSLAKHTQMVFQDPYLSLDPRIPVAQAVADVARLHGGLSRSEADSRASVLLDRVELTAQQLTAKPRALSGGQRQRVALAKALAAQPTMLVLDEATSALDVSVQARVLELVEEIRAEFGLTIVFVSHDLAVVSRICAETLVMQDGRVVEHGPTSRILSQPREDYTQRLIASRPVPMWMQGTQGERV